MIRDNNKKLSVFRGLLMSILLVALLVTGAFLLSGCTKKTQETGLGNGWEAERSMELKYATQFSVDYYQDGYKLIALSDGTRYLLVPEGKKAPKGIDEDIVVLQAPLKNIYLAATAAMCHFDSLDRLDAIKFSGTDASGWYIDSAREALENGSITYAGNYRNPDYEMLMAGDCSIAIESTMIGHAPEVGDKLKEFNIPVLTDQSSMEADPMGRTEWVKLYGALLDEEERAESVFAEQEQILADLGEMEDTGKSVVFFCMTSNGQVVVRKSGDYVSKMIEMAGGKYAFDDLGDENAMSTVTIDMETFYATAKKADVLIYNSTIDGTVDSLAALENMSPLFKNFKAVKKGNVWCTGQNLYQETTGFGQMIRDIHTVLTDENAGDDQLTYLYRLQ